MKKILIPLNILSLCVIAVLLLSNKEKTAETLKKDEGCDTTICMNYYGTKFHTLNGTLLQIMAQKYRQASQKTISNTYTISNRITLLGKGIPTVAPLKDPSSTWFSLDSLKHFIWEIESQICKNGCQTPSTLNLGIRIYYARYPLTGKKYCPNLQNPISDLSDLPEEFENMHTVFMVPTYDLNQNGITRHIDCDPQYQFTNCLPRSINSFMEGGKVQRNTSFTIMSSFNGSNSAMNHGGLCPPVCYPGDAAFGQ
jgi:hypothetical protein